MLISVKQLFGKEDERLEIDLAEMPEDIAGYPNGMVFVKPVSLKGEMTQKEGIFLLTAKGHTMVNLPCDRCLKAVEEEITFDLEERFSRAGTEKEETETFSEDEINLTDVVKRSILGALPMKVLCKEDCQGLCPMCGKDLNDGDCGCDRTYRDPRFESLRALFQDDEEV